MARSVIYEPAQIVQTLRFGGALIGCTETSAAMLADAVTLGGVHLTEIELRKASGEWPPDPASPGLRQSQVVKALGFYGIYYRNMTGREWDQLVRAVDANRKVIAQLHHDAFAPVPHAVLLTQRKGGKMLVHNPLHAKAEWVAESTVRAGMVRLANGAGLYWGQSRNVPYRALG